MIALAPIAPRLGQLVRLLASPIDGEALAAARALDRTLQRAGGTLHDLAEIIERGPETRVVYRDREIVVEKPFKPARKRKSRSPPAPWQVLNPDQQLLWLDKLLACDRLNRWETGFVSSLRAQLVNFPDRQTTPRQRATVDEILARAWSAGGRA